MDTLMTIGRDIAIVGGGLVLRFLIAAFLLALLLVPLVLVVMGWDKMKALRARATGVAVAGTVPWSRDAYYAPWHTWFAPAGAGLARIGVDALAERLLAPVTAVEIAAPGTRVRAGEAFARIACGQRAAALRAPVDSLIVKINGDAERRPALLHEEPYRRGWLAVVAPSSAPDAALKHGEPARQWLAGEERRLRLSMEHALGFAAADGGDLIATTPELLSDPQWQQVAKEFL
jgi:glycine cleavage system H lipoate-binding protein